MFKREICSNEREILILILVLGGLLMGNYFETDGFTSYFVSRNNQFLFK